MKNEIQSQNLLYLNSDMQSNKPARHGKRWNSQEIDQLMNEVEKGTSLDDIASTLQRTQLGTRLKLAAIAAQQIINGELTTEDVLAKYPIEQQDLDWVESDKPRKQKAPPTELLSVLQDLDIFLTHYDKQDKYRRAAIQIQARLQKLCLSDN